jgi:hypothetical protein
MELACIDSVFVCTQKCLRIRQLLPSLDERDYNSGHPVGGSMAVTGLIIPEKLIRLGDCELNAAAFQVRRGRRTVKLERIPLQVLLMLIEEPGKLVTREAIAERLWGKDVFVESTMASTPRSGRSARSSTMTRSSRASSKRSPEWAIGSLGRLRRWRKRPPLRRN